MGSMHVYAAAWFDYGENPRWASKYCRNEDAPVVSPISPICAKEIEHLCHQLLPDTPQYQASVIDGYMFDTAIMAEISRAELNSPLVIRCLFTEPFYKPTRGERQLPIDAGTISIWWLLIEKSIGPSAVPLWLKRIHSYLARQLQFGKAPATVLKNWQIDELHNLLGEACREIVDSFDTTVVETIDQCLFMGFVWDFQAMVSTCPIKESAEIREWNDGYHLSRLEPTGHGIFLTQSMCNLLVDLAHDETSTFPVTEETRGFLIQQASFLQKSGGVLITNKSIFY